MLLLQVEVYLEPLQTNQQLNLVQEDFSEIMHLKRVVGVKIFQLSLKRTNQKKNQKKIICLE